MKDYKNYGILALILIGTLIVVVYALRWHNVYEEERQNRTFITENLHEIKIEEFENYIVDNRDAVIYFGLTDDVLSREFETSFRRVIVDYHLQEQIVYMNVNELRDNGLELKLEEYYGNDDLSEKDIYLSETPALAVFVNAKLVDYIAGSRLNVTRAVSLLKEYDVIEDIEEEND